MVKSVLKHRSIVLYGLSLAILLFLLKWMQIRLVVINHAYETYILMVALMFTTLGIWLAINLAKPGVRTVIVEKEVIREREVYIERTTTSTPDEKEIARLGLGLSSRELEVLQLMSEGLTNAEIGARLFLSLNTIKTHTSRLFEKLDVTRRTQAVDKAKKLNII